MLIWNSGVEWKRTGRWLPGDKESQFSNTHKGRLGKEEGKGERLWEKPSLLLTL
jgi:hypothetical protein